MAQIPKLTFSVRPAPTPSKEILTSSGSHAGNSSGGSRVPAAAHGVPPAPSVRLSFSPARGPATTSPVGRSRFPQGSQRATFTGAVSGAARTSSIHGGLEEKFKLPAWPYALPQGRDFQRLNDDQVVYEPRSQLNVSWAAIPRTLASETAQAMDALEQRCRADGAPSVDVWVCQKLGWSREHLGRSLSSEQVDAVALAMRAMDDGGGMLIGDVTGFGKGRILATVSLYAVLQRRPVIFFSETDNLFSNFWQDIADIGATDVFGRPFILNSAATIIDFQTRQPVFAKWRPAEVRQIVSSGTLPDDIRLVMTTYSQFNRQGPRSRFLEAIVSHCHVVTDEAQNLSQEDAATAAIVGGAFARAASATYASATAGRDLSNLRSYNNVFPFLSRIDDIEALGRERQQWMAEFVVQDAVKAGRLIRREQDMSNVVIDIIEDPRLDRAIVVQNALAPVLHSLSELNRAVERLLEERNAANEMALEAMEAQTTEAERKAARERWSVGNFGGRQSAVVNQMIVSLLIDTTVDECAETLLRGEKPIVVIDTTMESVMKDMFAEGVDEDTLSEESSLDEALRPPTFSDVFRIMPERIMRVNLRQGNPLRLTQVTLSADDLPDGALLMDNIEEAIANFPDFLDASPLDAIREGVERRSQELVAQGRLDRPWAVGEISGRSTRIVAGRYERIPAEDRDRNILMSKFNHDDGIDVMLLTRRGSTGLSLHDSEKNRVAKRRHLIEVKGPDDPLKRQQMFGRPRRRGQRSEPRFSCLSTGLPYHLYRLASQNAKMTRLSSSVSANARSRMKLDIPDFLNQSGNEVAREMLVENPHIAQHLNIFMGMDDEQAARELYFVNAIFRRAPLLDFGTQSRVFSDFMTAYQRRMSEFGVVRDTSLGGGWTLAGAHLLELPAQAMVSPHPAPPQGEGQEACPTVLARLERESPERPLGRQVVESMVGQGIWPDSTPFQEWIRDNRNLLLEKARGRLEGGLEALLSSRHPNAVTLMNRKLTFVLALLQGMTPGRAARMVDRHGEETHGIITGLRLPGQVSAAARFREYEIAYVIPGDSRERHVTLDQMVRAQGRMTLVGEAVRDGLMEQFQSMSEGPVRECRLVILGDMLRGTLLAARSKVGTKVHFEDIHGVQHHAVEVSSREVQKLSTAMMSVPNATLARLVLEMGESLQSAGIHVEHRLRFRLQPHGLMVHLPRGREGRAILKSPFGKALALDRLEQDTRWPIERVRDVLREMEAHAQDFYCLPALRTRLAQAVSPPVMGLSEVPEGNEVVRENGNVLRMS